MRISELHVYQKDLELNQPCTMAATRLLTLDSTIVKLVTDKGLVGWGETCPVGPIYQPEHAPGARAALTQMAPALIGESALTPGQQWSPLCSKASGSELLISGSTTILKTVSASTPAISSCLRLLGSEYLPTKAVSEPC